MGDHKERLGVHWRRCSLINGDSGNEDRDTTTGKSIRHSIECAKPREQVMYAKESRVREVMLPKPFGAQNTMSETQMQGTELEDLICTAECLFYFDLIIIVP